MEKGQVVGDCRAGPQPSSCPRNSSASAEGGRVSVTLGVPLCSTKGNGPDDKLEHQGIWNSLFPLLRALDACAQGQPCYCVAMGPAMGGRAVRISPGLSLPRSQTGLVLAPCVMDPWFTQPVPHHGPAAGQPAPSWRTWLGSLVPVTGPALLSQLDRGGQCPLSALPAWLSPAALDRLAIWPALYQPVQETEHLSEEARGPRSLSLSPPDGCPGCKAQRAL